MSCHAYLFQRRPNKKSSVISPMPCHAYLFQWRPNKKSWVISPMSCHAYLFQWRPNKKSSLLIRRFLMVLNVNFPYGLTDSKSMLGLAMSCWGTGNKLWSVYRMPTPYSVIRLWIINVNNSELRRNDLKRNSLMIVEYFTYRNFLEVYAQGCQWLLTRKRFPHHWPFVMVIHQSSWFS